MDSSLYYSAPRPYNKYPRGYRPMQDTNNIDGSTSRLRSSSSWSSFSPLMQQPQQQQQQTQQHYQYSSATLPHAFPCTSPTNYWQQETSRVAPPVRTESSSTLFDNYNNSVPFSPRELSPLSTSSNYCNNPPPAPEMPRCYDNVPRMTPSYHTQRETDFLQNLQRQKEQAQQPQHPVDMSQSWYGRATSPMCSPPAQHQTSQYEQQQQQLPRRLTKTQSDVSFDTMPPTFYNRDRNNSQTMETVLRNRVLSPNWMTDPPPPKSIREDFIIRTNPMSTSGPSTFEQYRLEPDYRERPMHLQNQNFRNYHRDAMDDEYNPSYRPLQQQQQAPPAPVINRGETFSPSYNNNTNSMYQQQQNRGYQNIPSMTPVAINYREQREAPPPPSSNRNSAIFSNEPIPLTHNRVLHIHPLANQETYQQFNNPSYVPAPSSSAAATAVQNRARIQSPMREFARLTSPIRDLGDLHHHHRVPQQQPPQPQKDDRIFSPVESKVFNRTTPTVINGFTSNRHTYNSHTDEYDTRNRRDSSQPPVAVIEPNINVSMPSDPMPYQKPHYGRDQHPAYNNFLHQSHQKQSFSPVSNYENDSDLDIEEMARKALPKYLRDDEKRQGNLYRDNLHGILIKNPSLHRSSSKKVVFIDQDKGGQAASAEAPAHVRAYDDAVEGAISRWADLTDQIGGDIVTLKPKVLSVFDKLRTFLWTAAGVAEPSADESQKMLTPLIQLITEITEFKDSKRNTGQFNHLSTIAEGLPAVGWVVIKKTPAPYIKEFIEASTFFINRILKEFKETDPRHVEWVKAWKEIFEELQKFVRQTHTTGLVWNSAPGSAPAASSAAAPAPKGPGGPPPPPPPPIPADLFANMPPAPAASAADKDKSNRDALFAALNKGEAITAGLKKVTSDMQTHKNPNLRGNVAAPASKTPAASAAAAPAQPVRKPPKKELQDFKQWNVEYFVNDKNIVIDVTDKKQTIYIFRCENSTIRVNGKANSITLDGCKKTAIVFDALVAQCETINCQSVQIQTLGELPTLSIQKTDGCQVYLSKPAQSAEIVTSKSSEMNILIQTEEDGDYVEFPVPEQFKTTFVNGKLVTTVSDIV